VQFLNALPKKTKKELKMNERDKKTLVKLDKYLSEDIPNLEIDEDILEITLKANQFYSKAIKKYLKTVAVIEFNTVKFIKEQSINFKDRTDMNNFIVQAIKNLKDKKELTKVEQVELKTLMSFKEQVLEGKGKEYDLTNGFGFEYDENVKVDFEPIEFAKKENIEA
jgi:hypothetical protein